jgi:hypothetical protein
MLAGRTTMTKIDPKRGHLRDTISMLFEVKGNLATDVAVATALVVMASGGTIQHLQQVTASGPQLCPPGFWSKVNVLTTEEWEHCLPQMLGLPLSSPEDASCQPVEHGLLDLSNVPWLLPHLQSVLPLVHRFRGVRPWPDVAGLYCLDTEQAVGRLSGRSRQSGQTSAAAVAAAAVAAAVPSAAAAAAVAATAAAVRSRLRLPLLPPLLLLLLSPTPHLYHLSPTPHLYHLSPTSPTLPTWVSGAVVQA